MQTLPVPKNLQEALDNVVQWFLVQDHPQCKGVEMCFYRNKDNGCGIGCQLPDEVYEKTMEGSSVNMLFGKFRAFTEAYQAFDTLELRDALRELQWAHDNSTGDFKESLQDKLKDFATVYNLTFTYEG